MKPFVFVERLLNWSTDRSKNAKYHNHIVKSIELGCPDDEHNIPSGFTLTAWCGVRESTLIINSKVVDNCPNCEECKKLYNE